MPGSDLAAGNSALLRPACRLTCHFGDSAQLFLLCEMGAGEKHESSGPSPLSTKQWRLNGSVRSQRHKTTIRDRMAPCPHDKVSRQRRVTAPNRLWISDFTHVATRNGFVCVAFAFVIFAYARKIVGWRVGTSAHAGLVLDTLEQAGHDRRPGKGMVHHGDRGSQYLPICCGERLAEPGI